MHVERSFESWARLALVIAVIGLGVALRWSAVTGLKVDYDEPIYLIAGKHYADSMATGEWRGFTRYTYNEEHPAFYKIVYGLAMAAVSPPERELDLPRHGQACWQRDGPECGVGRLVSFVLSCVLLVVVTVISPWAGLFLALHGYVIKYTSQVYLDALPLLTSALCCFAYLRALRAGGAAARWGPWLALSAVMLGMTAASKYLYCVVGLAIAADWVWRSASVAIGDGLRSGSRALQPIFGWGLLSLVVFFALNPYLWPDPSGRLAVTVGDSIAYSRSEHVVTTGLPWHQPFFWLFKGIPWHPGVIVTRPEPLIAVLGILGAFLVWSRQRVVVLWLIVGMVFLLFWNTKWPQYILAVAVPISLCAAETTNVIVRWLWRWCRLLVGRYRAIDTG